MHRGRWPLMRVKPNLQQVMSPLWSSLVLADAVEPLCKLACRDQCL